MRVSCVLIFCKITGPIVLRFHLEHDLTPGSQDVKLGQVEYFRMATVTKNSKINQFIFLSRTNGCIWKNFNGTQILKIVKNEKYL